MKMLNSVIKSAGFLGRLDLRSLTDTYNQSFKKCLMTIYANPEPIIEFDRLPSERFRTLEAGTNLRKKCFRSAASFRIIERGVFLVFHAFSLFTVYNEHFYYEFFNFCTFYHTYNRYTHYTHTKHT